MIHCKVFFCISVTLLISPIHAKADDIDVFLEGTLSAVRTLAFDFNVTASDIKIENMKGKFVAVLQNGRIIRLRSRYDGAQGIAESIIVDGKHIGYNEKTKTYTVNSELEIAPVQGNPLYYALWLARVKDKPFCGSILTSLREQPHTRESISPSGRFHDAVFYSIKYDNTVQLLGFSPSHNYLPCYRKMTPTNLLGWTEDSVETFSEITKGVFFPTVINRKTLHPQTKQEYNFTKTIITNVRINEPISDSAFIIKYSEGDQVVDAIAKKVYTADKAGVLRDDKKMQYFDYGTRRDSTTGDLVTASAGSWNYYFWVPTVGILILVVIGLGWYIIMCLRKKGMDHA